MSVLISICIFILASYLLTFPVKPYLNRHMEDFVNEENYLYLQGIKNIPINEETNLVFDELTKLNCKEIDNKLDKGNMESSLYENEIVYTNSNNKVVHVKIVIDMFTQDNKAQYLPERKFVYSDSEYPNIDNEDYYLIIFRKDCIYYQAYPTGIDSAKVERDGQIVSSQKLTSYYDYLEDFSFSMFQSDAYFAVPYIIDALTEGYKPTLISQYSMVAFFYTVGFTLIVILLFFLFFKKNGRLKKFKEYYNIASIASIAPTLAIFGIMWFNISFIGYYIFVFAVYYLFVLYKINNARQEE